MQNLKKFQKTLTYGAAFGVLMSAIHPAQAHFLWADLAEADATNATPTVRLTLAEGPGEQASEALLTKIAATKLRGIASAAAPLQNKNGAWISPLTPNENVVGAEDFYGVLDKAEEGRGVFLLKYYAKAAKNAASSTVSQKLPFEISVRRDGEKFVGLVEFAGKPLEGAAVKLQVPDEEKPRELTSDAAGEIRFAAEKAGLYGVRAAHVENTAGVFEGKSYPMIRQYTTLSFRIAPSEISSTRNAVDPTAKADPAAYALLRGASERRQTLPANFVGFSADVVFTDNGERKSGKILYELNGKSEITVADLQKEQTDWLNHQLLSVINHRRSVAFDKGNGRFPVSFGANSTAQGRLVQLNDGQGSLFRVRDREVFEITRSMESSKFVIAILRNVPTSGDKYLPGDYVVSYRDPKTDALQRVDGFHDTYEKVGDAWLPRLRTVVTFEANSNVPRTRSIELSNYSLLK